MVDIRSLFKDGVVFFDEDVQYLIEYLNILQYGGVQNPKERLAQLRNILEDIVDFDKIN